MASRYFINGGINNNWGDTSNWSSTSGGSGGSSIPTSADDVFLDANSPNCTINTSARVCNSIDFAGYTNTITFSQNLTVSGAIKLASTMSFSGSAELRCDVAATLTSNGKTCDVPFRFPNAGTRTFADDWTFNYSFTTVGTNVLNGANITLNENLSITGATSGTTNFILAGTGTVSTSAQLRNDLTINTAGTITFSGAFLYGEGTLEYVAGTISGNPDLTCNFATVSLDTDGITWGNITFGTSSSVITLLGDLTCSGTYSTGSSFGTTINGAFTFYVGGGITIGSGGVWSNGTCLGIVLNGSGTWSGAGRISEKLTINTSGTITISGNVKYGGGGGFYYVAGTVVTTGSTITFDTTSTLDLNGISWNNVAFTGASTFTLLSNMDINGTITLGGNNANAQVINGFQINVAGSLEKDGSNTNATTSGTTVIVLDGTGTWSNLNSTAAALKNDITINTSGTITISGTICFNTGILTYTSGTVVTTGSTINTGIATAITYFDLNGLTINNLSFGVAGQTLQLKSNFKISGSIVNTTATDASRSIIKSNIGGTQRILSLKQGATQDLGFVDFTDIIADEQTIWTFRGTISNSVNIRNLTTPPTVAFTFTG